MVLINKLAKSEIKITKNKNILIPVLIICFNRPEFLSKLLLLLKRYNVKNLYISQDGVNNFNKNDIAKHNKVRNLITNINWTKNVKVNFFYKNLGKQFAPPKSIDWFFNNVKQGIILEDDTMPSRCFFKFCEIFLNKYSSNKKIFQICGTGTLPENFEHCTYFSSIPWIHGWATWRNRWKNYSYKITNLEDFKRNKNFKKNVSSLFGRIFWINLFKSFQQGKHKTWDYTIVKDCINFNWLCLKPSFNMISNIGYKNKSHLLNKRKFLEISKFLHLKNIENDFILEKSLETKVLYSVSLRYKFSLLLKYFCKLI